MKEKITTVVLGTHNPAKTAELKNLLGKTSLKVLSLSDVSISDEVEETGKTFAENAILKAKTYAQRANMPVLADDGGLEIDVLHGYPGVYSARIAGKNSSDEEKIALILEKMKNVPPAQRTAHFVVVLALAWPDGTVKTYEGKISGFITQEPRGKLIGGFRYRVIFLLPEYGKTLAELDEQKVFYNSHRDKAFAQLLQDF